jgi:hypothetical protein
MVQNMQSQEEGGGGGFEDEELKETKYQLAMQMAVVP